MMPGLFGLFERRDSLESPQVPLTSSRLLEWLGGATSEAGEDVSEQGSLGLSTVYRCTSLVSNVAAALPLPTYKTGTRELFAATVLDNPHPDLTRLELWRLSYVHRCLWGNSYLQKVRNGAGQITQLWPISPDRVAVTRVRPSSSNPAGKLFGVTDEWGKYRAFTSRDILHIPALGYDGVTGCSPVRLATQGIGMALAAERYAGKLFGSGNMMSGILQTEQRLNEEQARALKSRWRENVGGTGNAHEVAVLDSGASFQSVTMPNDDAQLLESRRFQVSDIARFFGVPPFLLGETEKSTSWGTGLEQQAQGWITFDLHPQWLAPTEQRLTKELFTDVGVPAYAKYKLEGLLRGDSASRAEFYRTMREVGGFSANDIRELEDRPPIPDGDGYLQPLNLVPLGTEPAPPPDPAAPPAEDSDTPDDGNDEGNSDAS
jgi:HK97 family phage portal protein